MVGSTLNQSIIENGAEVVSALDSASLTVTAALWFYFAETDTWRLLLEIKEVKTLGPHAIYKRVQRALSSSNQITLEEIAVLKPGSDIVNLLDLAVGTGAGIEGIRFSGNVVDGILIHDAYIYRLGKGV